MERGVKTHISPPSQKMFFFPIHIKRSKSLDINNKDIRDANKANDESDDEGESMDWWSKYFASLDKLIMVKFIVYCQ